MSKRDLQRRLDWLWQRQSPVERGRLLVEAVNERRLRNEDFGKQDWDDVFVFMETQIPGYTRKMADIPDEVLDAIAAAADDEEAEGIAWAYLHDAPIARRPEPEPEPPEPEPEPLPPEPEPEPEPEPIPEPDPPNLTLRYFGSRSFLLKDDSQSWTWHVMPDGERAFPAAEARALAARIPDLEVIG